MREVTEQHALNAAVKGLVAASLVRRYVWRTVEGKHVSAIALTEQGAKNVLVSEGLTLARFIASHEEPFLL